jgi:hypothetical protein
MLIARKCVHFICIQYRCFTCTQSEAYVHPTFTNLSESNFPLALYNIEMGWGFQILFTLSSQLIGISFAGLFRRFLIWYVRQTLSKDIADYLCRPAAMIWPSQFSNISLFFALHEKSTTSLDDANGWRISRYRWFLYVLGGAFVWYW